MKKIIYIFIVYSMVFGQDDYELWLKKQQSGFEALVEEENSYMAAITKEFDDYQAEQERLYQNFKDEVEKKWDEFKSSSKKTYVDYDGDLNARGSIDFENGVVEVEVIVDADPKQTSSEEKKAGEDLLKKKLTQMVKKEADDAINYFFLGSTEGEAGNKGQKISNYRKAARLGSKFCQDWLKENGYDW